MKSQPTIALGVAVLATMLALPGAAFGATITVNTTADAVGMDTQCSLREAITSANADSAPFGGPGECAAGSGSDTVAVPAGTFELSITGPPEDSNASGDLDIAPTQLRIAGAGSAASTIDANQIDRVLEVLAGATVTIEGVTLTGGRSRDGTTGPAQPVTGGAGTSGANGGGILNAGGLTIRDSRVSNNTAGNGGNGGAGTGASPLPQPTGEEGGPGTGGIGGDGGDGGGIFNSGNLALIRVEVLANTAGRGGNGGLGTGGQGGFGTTNPSGAGGQGTGGDQGEGGFGGGVASVAGASLNIDLSRIAGNTAGAAGNGGFGQGGLGGPNSSSGNPAGNGGEGLGGTFPGGDTAEDSGSGGGIGAVDGLVLTRSLIEENSAGRGGDGGDGDGGDAGDVASTTSGSNAGNGAGGRGGRGGFGGGVWAGNASIINTTITGNLSGRGGDGGDGTGGQGGSTLGSTPGTGGNGTGGLSGEGGSGGGVMTVFAATTIRHDTISSNALRTPGTPGNGVGGPGGVGSTGPGLTGTSSPGFSGATGTGSAVRAAISTTLSNTIFADNPAPACSGLVVDGGHIITFPNVTCPGALINPQLDPLADNGGPTRTQAVGPGSPALDAVPAAGAGCPATDQRGVTRPHGQGCEIGAYEHAGPDATTGDATAISGTGATLQGEVNPNGRSTSHHFEFGTTTAYGSTTPSQGAGAGVGAVPVSAAVTGLTAETTYHYRLVATSSNGTATGADRTFTTANARPRILSASVKPKVFAVLRRVAGGAKKGTTFRYRLSEAARVTFKIQRVTRGRRVGRRCRKETAANRTRRACKRFVAAGRFADPGEAGRNRKRFSGRIRKRALSPARYRATLVARDAAGNASRPKRLAFRVVRR